MIGTGGPSQGSLYSTPAIGAIAAMRSGSRQASSEESCAPLDIPTEKTRAVSMHRVRLEVVEQIGEEGHVVVVGGGRCVPVRRGPVEAP